MKRLVSWLLTLCLVFSMMPTASFAECSHENLTMTYDPKIERYYVDETTHYIEATIYNVCKDCGESVTYTSSMGYSAHEYINGVCKCGAVQSTSGSLGDLDFDEEEEEHTHSWEEVDRESVYEYYNEKYHREESAIVYYECECGAEKEKTKSGDGSKEQHRFNSRGVCKDCGYEEEDDDCSHKNLSLEYDPQYSYEVVDETYHHTYVTLYYKCDDCGEQVQKTQDSGNGKHWLENGKCTQCGYKESTSSGGAVPNPTLRGFDTPEPTATPTIEPTPKATATPTAEPTPKSTATPTAKTTSKPTATPTNIQTVTVVVTPKVTADPTSTPHVCIAGTPSHWYGVYGYYSEEQHTRHHVVTTYCIECGKELGKTNELEYVEHVFEDGKCEKCGWQCVHASTRDEIGTTPVGYVDLGREYHLIQYPLEQICNVCNQTLNTRDVGQEKTKHVFSNGYCKYCGYEEPLFSPDEVPTGRYINEELDSRFDYFTENIQGRGAQNILTRLIEEIETMEENAKSSDRIQKSQEKRARADVSAEKLV